MSENVRKLVGLVVMAALVVVGVAVSSGDDTDFTRNTAVGVPKLGGDLNDQVQQPGDPEELASRAMAAAAKCEEGRVLISTGDPVEPWRCGPLLAELAVRIDEDDRIPIPENPSTSPPCINTFNTVTVSERRRGGNTAQGLLEGQADYLEFDRDERRLLEQAAVQLTLDCLDGWASGRSVEEVNEGLDRMMPILDRACRRIARPHVRSVNGVVAGLDLSGWSPQDDWWTCYHGQGPPS